MRGEHKTTVPTIKRILLVSAAYTLGSCTFSPNLLNGNVTCHKNDDCPSGYFCDPVAAVNGAIGVCCKGKSCSGNLSPDQIAQIQAMTG